jgi:hypothetical protein
LLLGRLLEQETEDLRTPHELQTSQKQISKQEEDNNKVVVSFSSLHQFE